ncbi:MAG TPA: TonB-dependent receptor [Terriglobales bacterium]|nr:TonB-dependent receptor [Terriglobales bacterium]
MKVRHCSLLVVVCLSIATFGQTYQGRILGTVTDPSGAVVPGATVIITNAATNVSRTLTTGAGGDYIAPNLEPGPYQVTVEAPSFKKEVRTGLRLEVAKDMRIDVQLIAGAVTEIVNVSGEAPVVDSTTDVLGGTFSNQAINELPLQGRDFQNLAILQPGIQRVPGGGFLSINANGNRPEDNNFIVDGIDDNDAYYGETVINAEGVEGTPATHLPIDAIQEFNIQSSPEADYGWKPGAIVNVGIKSGSNSFHGSTYYFNRNSATDARNYFNPAPQPVSALNLNQFGASVGGPIFKDKLFYFANYEGVRDKVGNPGQQFAPVTGSLGGDPDDSVADAFAACAPDCSAISQKLATLLPFNPGPSDTINLDFNNVNREDNGILKLDYHLSDRHTFTGMYFVGDSLQNEEDVTVLNPMFLSQADTRAEVLGGGWVWTPGSNFTNQVHIGYNRFWQKVVVADNNINPATFGVNTGVTNPVDFGLPEIRIGDFSSHTIGGNGSWPLYTTPNQTLQISETANLIKNRHNLRFGGEFRTGSTDNVRDTYGAGYIRFDSLEDFAAGDPDYGYVAVGNSHRYVTQKSFGLFVQDDWRVRPRLTVTAGLRYDLTFPIKERHDLLANFDPTLGMVQVGKQISSPYDTDYNNFAPRLGFAFDPRGNGKTVVRAGIGVIYEIPHISVFIGQNSTEAQGLALIPTGLMLSGPGGVTVPSPGNIDATTRSFFDSDQLAANWQAGGPIFGDLSQPGQCAYDPDNGVYNPCPVFGVNRNIRTPYVINWNFNIEQALWKNAAITAAYVGNKGDKLYSIRDINQNIYANDFEGDEQSGRPFVNQFPYLSYIDMLGNSDDSIYHGLQVTVRQNTSHGLYFVAGYTYAHAIDTSSGNREFLIQNSYDPAAEVGNSDTDIRHRFTLATTYELPSRPGHAQMLEGWRVNSILTAQTGMPIFFFDDYYDISGTGEFNDRWNFFGDPSKVHWSPSTPLPYYAYPDNGGESNPACDAVASQEVLNYAGCFAGPGWVIAPQEFGQFGNMPRNMISGPGYFDMDFSVIKTFQFGERFKLEMRGEFFNVLNHPNFAGVDGDLSDGGISTGEAGYTPDVWASNPVVGSGGSRHIQLGAKIIW